MRKRGVAVDETCKLCGEGQETIKHLFFYCVKAKTIWKQAPVRWEGMDQQSVSFKGWWSRLENAANNKEMANKKELSAYIIWYIWKNKNRWIFNSENMSELIIVQEAWKEWMEYQAEQNQAPKERGSTVRVERRAEWKAPKRGWIKLNVSSMCGKNGNGARIWIVARDDLGSLQQTWAI